MEMLSAATIGDKIDKPLLRDLFTIIRDATVDCHLTIPIIDARRIVRKLITQNHQMRPKDIPREVSAIFLEGLIHNSLLNYLRHKKPIYYIKFILCLNRINLNIIEIMEEYENETASSH